jgi:transcriptional regulator with XRE-family HTH domain
MTATQLKRLRLKMKLSQGDLAQLIGMDANTLSRAERGELAVREPNARMIQLLAEDERVFQLFMKKYGKKKKSKS